MEVTDELITKLCNLAKLEFTPEERATLQQDLQRMLAFVGAINRIDTAGVEPLIHLTEEVNHLRADVVQQEITQAEALKNAPQHDSDYIRVPKVLEKS